MRQLPNWIVQSTAHMPGDSAELSQALQAALASWQDERDDLTIAWLRRAVTLADAARQQRRAEELSRAAAELEARAWREHAAAPSSAAVPTRPAGTGHVTVSGKQTAPFSALDDVTQQHVPTPALLDACVPTSNLPRVLTPSAGAERTAMMPVVPDIRELESAPSPSTSEPAQPERSRRSVAPTMAAPVAFAPMQAVRVAVLPAPGVERKVLLLAPDEEPPSGAQLALLLPLEMPKT